MTHIFACSGRPRHSGATAQKYPSRGQECHVQGEHCGALLPYLTVHEDNCPKFTRGGEPKRRRGLPEGRVVRNVEKTVDTPAAMWLATPLSKSSRDRIEAC